MWDEWRGGEYVCGDVWGVMCMSMCVMCDEYECGDGGVGESVSERNDEDVCLVVLLGVVVYD